MPITIRPATTVREAKAAVSYDKRLLTSLWPDAEDRRWKWGKDNVGWATIPKTFPQLFRAMDHLSKGAPLSPTYLALWCYTRNNGFVRLTNHQEMAVASGFDGQRAVRTWQERMRKLRDLGFIETREAHGNEFGYVFLPNPHVVLINHFRNKTAPVLESDYNDFIARAMDVRAKDVETLLAPPPPPAPAPSATPAAPSAPRPLRRVKLGEVRAAVADTAKKP